MGPITRKGAAAALLLAVSAGIAHAAEFRWSSDSDLVSLDPYARQENFLQSFLANIYEPLVRRGRDQKLEPALALSWKQTAPDRWRFALRPNVRFQDGSRFDADDVVYSFARATGPNSRLVGSLAGLHAVVKVDAETVDLVTNGADPLLPAEITRWLMVDNDWCRKNEAEHPADLAAGETNYASDHANGTGPFAVVERAPDERTVLARNADWWDKPAHNLDKVIFLPLRDPDARINALALDAVDMIYAVPPDALDRIGAIPHVRLIQGPEMRTIFLGFNVASAELPDSDARGRNPFRDLRVRKAVYQAIDEDAIVHDVMRGYARAAGLMVGPGVDGYDPALNQRLLPFDPAAARKLLAEAGYAGGFSLTLDCPDDRYINDAAICKAVAANLSAVGIRATPLPQERALFFKKLLARNYKSAFFLMGWSPATEDALNMLVNLFETKSGVGRGDYNIGGYGDPKLDALIAEIEAAPDPAKRAASLRAALLFVKNEVASVPLHQQETVWAARDNVALVQPPDGTFPLRYVRVKDR